MNLQETALFMCIEMEKKLIELMGADAYAKYSKELAKKAFLKEIRESGDPEYYEDILNHLDEIYGEDKK